MKVLVTGGAGFIGSHVVDYLISLGHRVIVVDNFSSGRDHWKALEIHPEIEKLNILNREALSKVFSRWQPNIVFHLAAHHHIPFCEKNPEEAYDLNVVGTIDVLREAGRCGVARLFFASTADVYAPSPRSHNEDDPIGPFTVYGRTKWIGEILCRGAVDWGWKGDLLIGRIFNAVGTRETNPHLVPEVINQIINGTTELRLGNLFPTRDFVDVITQARAIVDATLAVRGTEIINIGSGVAVRVGEMIDMIVSAIGKPIDVAIDPAKVRPVERANLCGTTTRLIDLIGYAPNPAGPATIQEILNEAKLSFPRTAAGVKTQGETCTIAGKSVS